MRDEGDVWLTASWATLDFLADARVRELWSQPSSLPQMTVADVAGHLVHSGILMVEEAFAIEDVAASEPVSAARLLSWVPPDADDPVHDHVREVAGAHGANGLDDLVSRAAASLRTVTPMVRSVDPQTLLAFPVMPSLSMTVKELLRSRIVELVVHVDDVAHSIGEQTIPLEIDAVGIACHVAIDINILRHGAAPVVRAMCRPDRNPVNALRTF